LLGIKYIFDPIATIVCFGYSGHKSPSMVSKYPLGIGGGRAERRGFWKTS
jgi:hypothetical protein